MSRVLFTCPDCKRDVVLEPPLSARQESSGVPMSRKTALFLFRHGDDGVCTDCMIRRRSESAEALMRKRGEESDRLAVAGFYRFRKKDEHGFAA